MAFLGRFGFLPRDGGRLELSGVFGGVAELGFQLRNPHRQRLNLRPQRTDQRILLLVRQLAEIRKLGHPSLQSQLPGLRQAGLAYANSQRG